MEAMTTKELNWYTDIKFLKTLFDICTPKKWYSDYIIVGQIDIIIYQEFALR